MSLRTRRRGAFRLALAAVATTGGVLLASPAWAHVTVHPSTLAAGSSDIELTFRVPNERDNANTVGLQVFFPTTLPLLTVDVLPVPGWNATVHTQNLAKPVQTDDGPVSQIVSDVTWTASGGGVAPGQYQDFDVAAGLVPDKATELVFKALQTYSSGEVVRWIEVPATGQPQPDFPAPVLALTPASASTVSAASHATAAPSASSSTADALAIVAVVLAAVNSVVLVLLLARSRRNRSTS
jgi:uncharacterized protein YcnI